MQIIPIIERADKHGKRCLEYNSATRTLEAAAKWFTALTEQQPGNVYELTAPLKLGLGNTGPDVTYWFFEWSSLREFSPRSSLREFSPRSKQE